MSTPSPNQGQTPSPFLRQKSASPWRVTRFSPYLRTRAHSVSNPNPLLPRPPSFSLLTSSTAPANPLYQSSASVTQSLPEKVVRITLSFSLRENGKGRNVKKEELAEIKTVFPNLRAVSYCHPYLMLVLAELPEQPWPTFLADLPLWLTTSRTDFPFKLGLDARASLCFSIQGKIEEYETPDRATILEIFKLINDKNGGIDRIQWNGLGFMALGKQEPAKGWKNRLPSRVNGFRIGYIWEQASMEERAFRLQHPARDLIDDTAYHNSLRPGVMLEGFHNDMQSRLRTTSGICVQSANGEKYITVAAHGFPAGIGDVVYHPTARLDPSSTSSSKKPHDSFWIGTIDKVFGDTDIALAKLRSGINYSRETFSDPSISNVQPFRSLKNPEALRSGDSVFMNTPVNGLCEGVHVVTQWGLAFEATDHTKEEEAKHLEIACFSYWGNGSDVFLDGCCGGIIWDANYDVIGQFRFQEKDGGKLAWAPSFEVLREQGVAGGIGTGWLHAHLKSTQALTHFTIYIIHPSAPGNLKSILSLSAPPHHKYEIIPLDLSSPTHIKALTTSLTSRITSKELPQISLLLLIAGGMFLGPASTDQGVRFTSDGLELSYAVNYLANYLLITLLLPILSPTSARIIFIGSTSHNPAYASNAGAYHKPEMKIMFHDDFEALARGKVKIEKGDEFPASVRRYGGSKLCMTMLMYEMNRKFRLDPKRQHIHFLAYDPGVVGGTELTNSLPWYIRIVMQYMLVPIQTISVWIWRSGSLRTATVAGEDLEWCCWDESVQSGEYRNGRLVGESSPESMDQGKWGQLLEGTKAVIASLEEWERLKLSLSSF